MDFARYRYLVASDLYRYFGETGRRSFWRNYMRIPGFRYMYWLRTCAYTRERSWSKWTLYIVARLMFERYTYKYGISIPCNTALESGFYIGHFGGIVVNEKAKIGKNCNISQGVTIGQVNRGERAGVPTIGDNVYIGPGVKIIGGIRIGNNVAIGANAVVTKDIPDNGVVVGIPGKVISEEGSVGYINNTDYEEKLRPKV